MVKVKHWRVTWFCQSQRDYLATICAKYGEDLLSGSGYSLSDGFKTREEAERRAHEYVEECKDWRGGDTRIDKIEEVEDEFDDEELVARMIAARDGADWGVFLHGPGDAYGDMYEECAKRAGVRLDWYTTNGDQRLKIRKVSAS